MCYITKNSTSSWQPTEMNSYVLWRTGTRMLMWLFKKSLKWEKTQPSTLERNEEIFVYSSIGMLYSNENESITTIHNNICKTRIMLNKTRWLEKSPYCMILFTHISKPRKLVCNIRSKDGWISLREASGLWGSTTIWYHSLAWSACWFVKIQ